MPKEDYIETIPVGPLGIISLKGCSKLGNAVEDYIVEWRNGRTNTLPLLHFPVIRETLIMSKQNALVLEAVRQNALSPAL